MIWIAAALFLAVILFLLIPRKRGFVQERVQNTTRALDAEAATTWSRDLYTCAAMSELSYRDGLSQARLTARKEIQDLLDREGWKLEELTERESSSRADGLYFEVWVRQRSEHKPEIVIAFRGTEATDFSDWLSNARWFLFGRRDKDQYAATRNLAGLLRRLVDKYGDDKYGGDVDCSTTGHSLGGGLAQHLYYFSFSQPDPRYQIDACRVFNSSPVTGALQMGDRDVRERARREFAKRKASMAGDHQAGSSMWMKHGFGSVRAHESGEALEKIRDVTRFVRPLADFITEVRFDFAKGGNVVHQHSMLRFAQALIEQAQLQ